MENTNIVKDDERFGILDESDNIESFEEAKNEKKSTEVKKGFLFWNVGKKTYQLKLTTKTICELEQRYRKNLMNIMGTGEGGMPPLTTMIDITQAAMKEWHHGIKKDDVFKIYDKYIEKGGSQLGFYMDIYMKIFTVSGFFPKSVNEDMKNAFESADEMLN